MPELPEVESIRGYLDSRLVGKTISSVSVLSPASFHGAPESIIGKTIIATGRGGKVLTLTLSDSMFLSIHLKLSGQLLFHTDHSKATFSHVIPLTNTDTMPGVTTRVIIFFTDNSVLYFNDSRRFGWIKLSDKPEVPKGVDVCSEKFTVEYLSSIIAKTAKPIKTLLLDQALLAGIGNIYANDSLYEAKIHPSRKSKTLLPLEISALFDAIKLTISEGIKYKGSSSADEVYLLPDASQGEYQHHFRVYHKTGTKCQRCGSIIKRYELSGRGTYFCPSCQQIS